MSQEPLVPLSPLTDVAAVRGYLQFVFAAEVLNAMNPVEIVIDSIVERGPGVAIASKVRQLVGTRVLCTRSGADALLTLVFEGGARVSVLADSSRPAGTEAFVFQGQGGYVVEHNT